MMYLKEELTIMSDLVELAQATVPVQAGIWSAAGVESVPGRFVLQLELNGHIVCLLHVNRSIDESGDVKTRALAKGWLMPGGSKMMQTEQPFGDLLVLIRATLWETARIIVHGLSSVMAEDEGLVVADA